MYLSDDELRTLKESLRRFQMKSGPLSTSLHSDLSHRAPETLTLFGVDDRASEPNELLQSLCVLVVIVDANQESAGLVEGLRLRAAKNRVQPEAYAKIGPALERSMRQVFCNRLPDQYCGVWKAALGVVGSAIYNEVPTVYESRRN